MKCYVVGVAVKCKGPVMFRQVQGDKLLIRVKIRDNQTIDIFQRLVRAVLN